jgi:hypothetical protein
MAVSSKTVSAPQSDDEVARKRYLRQNGKMKNDAEKMKRQMKQN